MTIDATRDELALLFDAALDAVIAMTREGNVAAWSKQAEAIFGWRREEAIGQPLASLIIPTDLREAHWKGLAHYLDVGDGPVINRRIEVRALHRDGREFPAELTILPLQQSDRLTFFAFVRDITNAKRAETELTRRALEAQVLYEATTLLAEEASFQQVLSSCLHGICRASGWSIGHAYLPDRLNSMLIPSDVWYAEDVDISEIRKATQQTQLRLGEGLPGRIWAAKTPYWIPDITTDENFLRRFVFSQQGIKSAFGFPVFGDGRLLAVLEFFTKTAKQPDEQLLALAQSIGQQLGRAIERQNFLEHQQALVRELSHRVSNMMTVVSAVFHQALRHAGSLKDLERVFTSRLHALATASRVMTEKDWKSAPLNKLIEATLRPHCGDDPKRCHIAGPTVELGAPAVMPLSLVLHELGTNATKYGALSVPNGSVHIGWTAERLNGHPAILRMHWREHGGPHVEPPQRKGYGMDLIRETVEKGMGGTTSVMFNPNGFAIEIELPLPALDA